MKNYIRENIKFVVCTSVLVLCIIALLITNTILINRVVDLSTLQLTEFSMDEDHTEYAYTGEDLTPGVSKVVMTNDEGETIVKENSDITIVKYIDNQDIGYADIEVSLEGYKGTVLLKNAIRIGVSKVDGLKISKSTRKSVTLTWDAVLGADGYQVYKKTPKDKEFKLLKDLTNADTLTCKDKDLQTNATYEYCVCAYTHYKKEQWLGEVSEPVIHQTPLAIPELTEVSCTDYTQLQLKWKSVDGAGGYQIYRSGSATGKYTCIKKLKDGKLTSYTDTNLECGKTYYYYIKANQEFNGTWIVGDASNTISAQTRPNSVSLNGTRTETSVSLKWNVSSGSQGFELYRSTGDTSDYKLIMYTEVLRQQMVGTAVDLFNMFIALILGLSCQDPVEDNLGVEHR